MIGFLRFVGLVNAAIWFGSAIFFTFCAAPVFFSAGMKQVIPPPYNGLAAELLIHRYFTVQLVCAAVAVTHLVGEWLYTGRPMERLMLVLLGSILCLGLIGGWGLEPHLKQLHRIRYGNRSTPAEKEQAGRSFSLWHGISQLINLGLLGGISFYFWRMTQPRDTLRFVSSTKFRG